MNNHTPGPWKIFDGYGASRFAPAVVDSIPDVDGKCVANCICHVASTNPDCVANAQLIAAAPDMLAALDYALTALQTLANTLGGISEEHAEEIIQDAAGKIGGAMAKAKEEQ